MSAGKVTSEIVAFTEVRVETPTLPPAFDLVGIMTQGGSDIWHCPGCGGDWSCLHFAGEVTRNQTHKSGGIRSDCLGIPMQCEHGHHFDLLLDVCSGAFYVTIRNFRTNNESDDVVIREDDDNAFDDDRLPF